MGNEILYILIVILIFTPIFWLLPKNIGEIASICITFLVLGSISLVSVLWLLASCMGTYAIMRYAGHSKNKNNWTNVWLILLVTSVVFTREMPIYLWIGLSYMLLRHIHILLDWQYGKLSKLTFLDILKYQAFLPVILAGPIHRYQPYKRQLERRIFDAAYLINGAERILVGLFLYMVISQRFLQETKAIIMSMIGDVTPYFLDWAISIFFWIQLYFSFAGLSSLAIGLALLQGIKIEENFNQPWKSINLIDFWSRWHMTLSNWVKQYIFTPVSAKTRHPAVGLFCAMLAIGLWHDTSLFYVLWAFWQSLGVIITRIFMKAQILKPIWPRIKWLGPVFVLLWLSSASPILKLILEG